MSEQKKNLAKFLARLSEDASLQTAMKSDPDGTMNAHGITGEEAEVMRSKDLARLQNHLGDFGAKGQSQPVW